LTGQVAYSPSAPGQIEVLYVTTVTGGVGLTTDTDPGAKSFRCVADPRN
jgi:hypothetical protein